MWTTPATARRTTKLLHNERKASVHLIVSRLTEAVIFTCRGFQTAAINNLQASLSVSNESRPLKALGGFTDGCAADTKHPCQKVMCEGKIVPSDSVSAHEQPPRAPLVDLVHPIAGSGANHLVHQRQ